MYRRVAIIGGGAAAATLLSELLDRQPAQPLHLDWYTGGGNSPRGVAYGTRSDKHLLNVRAASMSMFAARPHGFLEYAQRGNMTACGASGAQVATAPLVSDPLLRMTRTVTDEISLSVRLTTVHS